MMAFALFLFVSYGSIAEVTHRHGGIQPFSAQESSSASTTTEAFDNSSGAQSSSNTSSAGECLICQLHRDLFVSRFTHQLKIAPPTAHLVRACSFASLYYSLSETPRRGRAPPTSLV